MFNFPNSSCPLEFCCKLKMSIISKTVGDTAISSKFFTLEYYRPGFCASENFLIFQFLAAIVNFSGNGKMSIIWKTVKDTGISSKVGPSGYYKPGIYCLLKNVLLSEFWLPS